MGRSVESPHANEEAPGATAPGDFSLDASVAIACEVDVNRNLAFLDIDAYVFTLAQASKTPVTLFGFREAGREGEHIWSVPNTATVAKQLESAMHATLAGTANPNLAREFWVFGSNKNSPVASLLVSKNIPFRVFDTVRTDSGFWGWANQAGSLPLSVLSKPLWRRKLDELNLLHAPGVPWGRKGRAQANNVLVAMHMAPHPGSSTFRVRELDIRSPDEIHITMPGTPPTECSLVLEGASDEVDTALKSIDRANLTLLERRAAGSRTRIRVLVNPTGFSQLSAIITSPCVSMSMRAPEHSSGILIRVEPAQWDVLFALLSRSSAKNRVLRDRWFPDDTDVSRHQLPHHA